MLPDVNDDDVEETEIVVNDTEPVFLRGQTAASGAQLSPVKIVREPDGSLQRAANQAGWGTVSNVRRSLNARRPGPKQAHSLAWSLFS